MRRSYKFEPITVIMTGIILFGVPMLLGGIIKTIDFFKPKPAPTTPIWVWIIVGIAVLMLIKTMTSRPRAYPPGY